MNALLNLNIIGLYVYLERRKTRLLVGELKFDKRLQQFTFVYADSYLRSEQIIPIGPELPLTQKKYVSKDLFPSFLDRIPAKENPAYQDYCQAMGIAVEEQNPLVLLATIGKRGPSSFVFEPHYDECFDKEALRAFRQLLNLTTREFASCFEMTQASLVNIEQGKSSGNEILKRMALYAKFPQVALYQVRKHGGGLHAEKRKHVIAQLNKHNVT